MLVIGNSRKSRRFIKEMHTRSKNKKSTTTNPKMLEEDSSHASVYEKPMHPGALKSNASSQEVVPFSKDVALTPVSRQGTSESLQLNQSIVALEQSATDASNGRIHSSYPTPIIQDPNMQIADPIVTKSSPNSVAKKITNTNDDVRTRTCSFEWQSLQHEFAFKRQIKEGGAYGPLTSSS